MKQKTERGRPKGATNVQTIQIVDLSRCPDCQKTDRTPYRLASCIDHAGITADGREFTHVVSRRTSCVACGRSRVDKFFENRAPKANPGEENEPDIGK